VVDLAHLAERESALPGSTVAAMADPE